MATILAFAGSNSSASVNFKLVKYTTAQIADHEIQLLNMANFPFPMYSMDHEKEKGFSNSLIEFKDDIQKADGLIISVNEHNSNVSAYFKNVIDWLSRLDRGFLKEKKILLMSCSPGGRGGISALGIVEAIFTRFGAEIVATFSLPSFNVNFDETKGILDEELATKHSEALAAFLEKI